MAQDPAGAVDSVDFAIGDGDTPEKSPTMSAGEMTDYGATGNSKLPGLELRDVGLHSGSSGASLQSQSQSELEKDLPCSWGPLSPAFCQILRNPKIVLICLCIAATVQGMVVNGFINVSVSTLELRYDLSSTQSGIIVSSYDIASVLSLLPVSYWGGIGRKPRWVGVGMAVLGIGSFIFCLPQFTTGEYRYSIQREDDLCYSEAGNMTDSCGDTGTESLSDYRYLFIFANLLHGAGAAPLYTIGVTYLDENLSSDASPLYLGIFYMMSIVGPAVGYLVGGQFLNIYVDVDSVDTNSLAIDVDNPNWVGAWWIGFILSGCLAIVIALPLCGFPTYLPGSLQVQSEKVSEAYQGSDMATSSAEFGQSFRDLPKSLKILLFNPTFMCLNLAAASEGLLVAGFSAFAPKFIEAQFSITAAWAATLVGFAAIPAGGGGMILGGYLTKRFQLKFPGMIKLCLVTVSVAFFGCLCFLFHCPNVDFAGVNVDYINHTTSLQYESHLVSGCNQDCNCLREWYEPVCSNADHTMFFSPCHAGCTNSTTLHGSQVFFECSCLETGISGSVDSVDSYPAVDGLCDSGCSLQLTGFLLVFAAVMLATFTTSMPALSATLRCVPDKLRSFSLGIQWILARCLGTIPGPILFGALIDKSCQLWEEKCGDQGSCYFYNNYDQSVFLMALALCFKLSSLAFFALSLWLYRPPEILDDVTAEISSASSKLQMIEQAKDIVNNSYGSYSGGLSNPALDSQSVDNEQSSR